MALIEIKALTKKFDSFKAVDNMDLKISEGKVFRLLGPNGAGKTATVYMLTTVLRPTSGSASINGFDIRKQPEKVRFSC